MNCYSQYLSSNGFCIFLFHGVIPEHTHSVRNYTRKHISKDRFEEVLIDLLSKGKPVSMQEIADAYYYGKSLPPFTFAITFDDGFWNNYSIALPILKKYLVPATFYITTRFIENNASSWIDIIEAVVEQSETISMNESILGIIGLYETINDKKGLLSSIRDKIKENPAIDPYDYAEYFSLNLDKTALVTDIYLDNKMSPKEISDISKDPLFLIGGHTHTHRIMSYLSDSLLQDEIDSCLIRLRKWTGMEINHFSYPEGMLFSYSQKVIHDLKKRGIVCSPSAVTGINFPHENPFHYKRILVI